MIFLCSNVPRFPRGFFISNHTFRRHHVLSPTGLRTLVLLWIEIAYQQGSAGTPAETTQYERKEQMGILATAIPAIVICTRDRARATAFYRDTLGLALAHEDNFAAIFDTGGVTLRVSVVPDFAPHEHTILGFHVPDLDVTVKDLREKGVTFNLYPRFRQDELGIWTAPGGAVRVAWFKDPDGNVLSVTNS
jgi:catechol 2,3-dioxygenase-like lactoylglutathione lyase family enzyme